MIWSKKLTKYKGFPRPFYNTSKKHYFKNGKRYLAKKVPVPYQSLPGDEIFAIKLNIENEKEVVENLLCPYCGIKIKDDEISIRWQIEKEIQHIDESRDLVPSDFHPFHLQCMEEGRKYCPFMRSVLDDKFDIDIQKNNLEKTKHNMDKYYYIKWQEKNRPYIK